VIDQRGVSRVPRLTSLRFRTRFLPVLREICFFEGESEREIGRAPGEREIGRAEGESEIAGLRRKIAGQALRGSSEECGPSDEIEFGSYLKAASGS
jgi:hypothetical protein